MAGRIPRAFINDLLARVDIVDLIDSLLPLKKAGSNYTACCPFHNEKTPSFSVNRQKQFFYCFGCGASGNAISFLMDFSRLNFVEAVEELASFVGVEIPHEQDSFSASPPKQDLTEIYQVLTQVAQFYAQQLRQHPEAQQAIAYLKQRGVSGVIARDFMLGYASNQWDALSKKFPPKQLLAAGLVIQKEDGHVYDRFRGRLMFPIKDKRGRIIGFGGRVLDDSLPKYLNSPETALFSKSQHVYGLNELLAKNSKPERILIVEGYMDVIALAQFDLQYAVATLGTATSKAHLDLLFRFSHELILCFDGDNAGRQAAWRAVEVALACLRDGKQIRIMLLPPEHDPDSLVRCEGADNFTQRMQNAQLLSDYFFQHLCAEINLNTREGRAQLVSLAKPLLEKIPFGSFKDMMFDRLKEISFMPSLTIAEHTLKPPLNTGKPKPQKAQSAARVAIALLIQNPHLAKSVFDRLCVHKNLVYPGLDVLKNLADSILEQQLDNTGVLLEFYRNTALEKTITILAGWNFPFVEEEKIKEELFDAITQLTNQAQNVYLKTLLNKKIEELSTEEKEALKKMSIINHEKISRFN